MFRSAVSKIGATDPGVLEVGPFNLTVHLFMTDQAVKPCYKAVLLISVSP